MATKSAKEVAIEIHYKYPELEFISGHRVREIAELEKEIHDPQQAQNLQSAAKNGLTVQLSKVDFSYIENKQVLTGSDFIARPNEIVALVGPSGEGKTTILRMLLGLIHPEEGEAVLLMADGSKAAINADVRGLFSYVPQGNTLLPQRSCHVPGKTGDLHHAVGHTGGADLYIGGVILPVQIQNAGVIQLHPVVAFV